MPLISEGRSNLSDRMQVAGTATAPLISQVIAETCRRFPSMDQVGKTARVKRLIESEAWTDAALALTDLELPLWLVRRIAFDGGEWYSALSRERELPDWLDRSVEAHHADLALAILSAFLEAQLIGSTASRPSVPSVSCSSDQLYEPICCDNFG